MGKLTDKAIQALKPTDKVQSFADGQGLSLKVHPNGGRYWRFRYRDAAGKAQQLSLGGYPEITLAEARRKLVELKAQRKQGVDPARARRDEKQGAYDEARNTFEAMAREWHADNQAKRWTIDHGISILRRMENHVFPIIGAYPLNDLDPQQVLRLVKAIEKSGSRETAKRVLQYVSQALRWGVQHGRATRDFTVDLRGALLPLAEQHHHRVTTENIPTLLLDIEGADVYTLTKLAIRWLFVTACRSGEMRGATWAEIDLERNRWTIPAVRMKMGTPHIVPLSRQALAVITEVRALGLTSMPDQFIFPAMQRQAKMMSENTIGYAFNRMGYAGRQTPHGIRGLFSTYCNESALWQFNDIELCLAHLTGNAVSRAYNSSQRVPERARILQWWADELDAMREGRPAHTANVVPLKKAG